MSCDTVLQEWIMNPRKLGYHDVEYMAREYVKHLSTHENITYRDVWNILDGQRKIMERAVQILNWNSAMEMADHPFNFVLEKAFEDNDTHHHYRTHDNSGYDESASIGATEVAVGALLR